MHMVLPLQVVTADVLYKERILILLLVAHAANQLSCMLLPHSLYLYTYLVLILVWGVLQPCVYFCSYHIKQLLYKRVCYISTLFSHLLLLS